VASRGRRELPSPPPLGRRRECHTRVSRTGARSRERRRRGVMPRMRRRMFRRGGCLPTVGGSGRGTGLEAFCTAVRGCDEPRYRRRRRQRRQQQQQRGSTRQENDSRQLFPENWCPHICSLRSFEPGIFICVSMSGSFKFCRSILIPLSTVAAAESVVLSETREVKLCNT
jgi:hypothetical protein